MFDCATYTKLTKNLLFFNFQYFQFQLKLSFIWWIHLISQHSLAEFFRAELAVIYHADSATAIKSWMNEFSANVHCAASAQLLCFMLDDDVVCAFRLWTVESELHLGERWKARRMLIFWMLNEFFKLNLVAIKSFKLWNKINSFETKLYVKSALNGRLWPSIVVASRAERSVPREFEIFANLSRLSQKKTEREWKYKFSQTWKFCRKKKRFY